MIDKFRTARRRVNNDWVDCEFQDLKKHDVFILIEDGKEISKLFKVDVDPVPCEPDGNYILKASPF